MMNNDGESLRNKAPEPCLSLRQIAKQLHIPPSTVTYYKDRFAGLLPEAMGQGRNRRYPPQALMVFAEIRELFACNWPAVQIEAHLAAKAEKPAGTAMAPEPENRPSPSPETDESRSEESGPDDTPALSARDRTLARLEENLAAFREQSVRKEDLEALKEELAAAREGQMRLERELAVREAVLLARIEELAAQGKRLEERLEKRLNERREAASENGERTSRERSDREDHQGRPGREEKEEEAAAPPREELDLPLVIQNEQGEYLGVSGGAKAFSLGDFLGVMERGGKRHRVQSMRWSKRGRVRSLSIESADTASKKTHNHVLETENLVTPLGNRVMRLVSLNIDGQATPQHLLLLLFRKIRDGFAA